MEGRLLMTQKHSSQNPGTVRNILAIDTSSKVLTVAISSGESVFSVRLEGSPRHSEHLIELVRHGLNNLGIDKKDLSHFLWGLGPGSFTGLRIGLSVAKGFAIGFGRPSYGISSLDVVAAGTGLVSGDLMVCIDARRERIYTSSYRFESGMPEKKMSEAVLTIDQVLEKLSPGCHVTGDAILAYGDKIRGRFGRKVFMMDSKFWSPDALTMIRLFEANPGWFRKIPVRQMTPKYLRRSEAEEKAGVRAQGKK